MDWIDALEAYARAADPSTSGVLKALGHVFRRPTIAVSSPHDPVLTAYLTGPAAADGDPLGTDAAREVFALTPEGQIEAILVCLCRDLLTAASWDARQRHTAMASRLLRRKLPWSDRTVGALAVIGGIVIGRDSEAIPVATFAKILETHGPDTPEFKKAVAEGANACKAQDQTAALRTLHRRLGALVRGTSDTPPLGDDDWGTGIRLWLDTLPETTRGHWQALFVHAQSAKGARPAVRWSKTAAARVDPVREEFAERMLEWIGTADLTPTVPHLPDRFTPGITEPNRDLLKGLIFACATHDDPRLPGALATAGIDAFVKIPLVGAKCSKIGNAVIAVLGALPDARGVAHLTRMAAKVRYTSARRLIERALDAAAEGAGLAREVVEEQSVPTFGLDADVREVALGEHQAVLTIASGKPLLRWRKPNGKPQKTVPKAVREHHGPELKGLKAEVKELTAVLEGQARRLETLWIQGWTRELSSVLRHTLEHPVVGGIARRLVWDVDGTSALWQDGALRDLGGAVVTSSAAPVRLWHPLTADPEEQLVWRDRFDELERVQPFLQLWRPVYRASDDGPTATTRFQGRVLHQPRLLSECQRRGWTYRTQGMWDGLNDPERNVPGRGLRVVLSNRPLHDRRESVFRYVVTGEAYFTPSPDFEGPMQLDTIDPLAFSELMLDLDRLVSACAVQTVPDTLPAGSTVDDLLFPWPTPLTWSRARVLTEVLPRTRLDARVEGSWLVMGNARIHLDTAAVQRNGEHVPQAPHKRHVSSAARVFLPHEGDPGLHKVLAQALALQEDQ